MAIGWPIHLIHFKTFSIFACADDIHQLLVAQKSLEGVGASSRSGDILLGILENTVRTCQNLSEYSEFSINFYHILIYIFIMFSYFSYILPKVDCTLTSIPSQLVEVPKLSQELPRSSHWGSAAAKALQCLLRVLSITWRCLVSNSFENIKKKQSILTSKAF